jgi:hypothetical protein
MGEGGQSPWPSQVTKVPAEGTRAGAGPALPAGHKTAGMGKEFAEAMKGECPKLVTMSRHGD